MYADDLIVLSASVSGLQRMLDMCYQFDLQNSLTFNQKKSVCFTVGRNHDPPLEQMRLGNIKLKLMYDLSRWKFLNGLLCGPASLRFAVFYELNRHLV